MRSMTGYGKSKCVRDGYELTVELKSVNNRFLDINLRVPKSLGFLDDALRKGIAKGIRRGTVDVFLLFENKSDNGKALSVDLPLARAYIAAAKKLRAEFLLDDDFQLTALMRAPDILKLDTPEYDAELITSLALEALSGAVEGLNSMRLLEGENLKKQLQECIASIAATLSQIEGRASFVLNEYTEKLRARIAEALGGVQVDEARLLNEVAFFADRCDINEEIARMKSHLNQFEQILCEEGEQGRRLDFLLQEINREINTIGSKSADLQMAGFVVSVKNEIEKLREQIRNIE